jgi:hypothetical protein
MKLQFFISEYVDGNLEIETKHMHYTFRDDMNYDDFTPDTLYEKMRMIREVCKKENITPYFEMR